LTRSGLMRGSRTGQMWSASDPRQTPSTGPLGRCDSSGARSRRHLRGRVQRVLRNGREDVVEWRRVAERAAPLLDVRLELVAELCDIARDRDRRRLAQRTEALAVDSVADIEQQVELVLLRVTGLESLEDLGHPPRSLTARRALATRLVLVELVDANPELHHAAAVVEHDHARGAHRRPELQQRVEVVAEVDLVVAQDRSGRPAGDHALELATAGNST